MFVDSSLARWCRCSRPVGAVQDSSCWHRCVQSTGNSDAGETAQSQPSIATAPRWSWLRDRPYISKRRQVLTLGMSRLQNNNSVKKINRGGERGDRLKVILNLNLVLLFLATGRPLETGFGLGAPVTLSKEHWVQPFLGMFTSVCFRVRHRHFHLHILPFINHLIFTHIRNNLSFCHSVNYLWLVKKWIK